ncbi:hypothetical protein ACE1SV_28010 [Streptomyces sp. E-15]
MSGSTERSGTAPAASPHTASAASSHSTSSPSTAATTVSPSAAPGTPPAARCGAASGPGSRNRPALRGSRAESFAVPGVRRGHDHTETARRLGARGVFEAYDALPDGDPAVLPPPPAEGTQVRWIYWTSGTTADYKGVPHTGRSLLAAGSCPADALRLSERDVGSMAFPSAAAP